MNGLLNPDDYEKGQSPTQHDAFDDAFDAATEALRRPGIEQSLRAVWSTWWTLKGLDCLG